MKTTLNRNPQGDQKWYSENRAVLTTGVHRPSRERRGIRKPRK
jgi:hypothetical protein